MENLKTVELMSEDMNEWDGVPDRNSEIWRMMNTPHDINFGFSDNDFGASGLASLVTSILNKPTLACINKSAFPTSVVPRLPEMRWTS